MSRFIAQMCSRCSRDSISSRVSAFLISMASPRSIIPTRRARASRSDRLSLTKQLDPHFGSVSTMVSAVCRTHSQKSEPAVGAQPALSSDSAGVLRGGGGGGGIIIVSSVRVAPQMRSVDIYAACRCRKLTILRATQGCAPTKDDPGGRSPF